MRRTLALSAVLLLLAGCAHDPKPAVCDGKHRRPANPYGSVLPADPSAPAAGPPPAHAPGPQSSIDPKSLAPCGGRA